MYTEDLSDDLFEPGNYAGVRLPRHEASTPPAWVYSSQRWFEREVTTLFEPAWHFVGLASSLAKPGDYLTRTLFGRSILIARGDDGEVRAFRNSCRHRGALVVEPEKGNCRAFRCPYHSWTYGIDGELLRAPGLEEEHGRARLRELGRNLAPVRCAVSEGLVFVNLSEGGLSLEDYLGDYVERVARPYRVADMVCVRRRGYTLESNWKLYVEVDMETLHTKHIHRGSIGEQPVEAPSTLGEWICVFNEDGRTPALHPKERHLGFPRTPGAYGPAELGTHFSILLPGFFLVTAPDCMWWIHKVPVSATRTTVDVGYCFPVATVERDDFAERAARYFRRWDQVIEEDDWITEYQQKGVAGSAPGCYTPEEHVVHRLDNWILDRVLGPELAVPAP